MNIHIPSPASSLASDTDAYNTADARIHFGPLRSPEKKFYPIVACPNTLRPSNSRPPLRRSPRLSTPCPSPTVAGPSWKQQANYVNIDKATGGSEEVANSLLPGTPEYDTFLRDGELIFLRPKYLTLSTHFQNPPRCWQPGS
jgi:hypothetical protein